MPGGGEERNLTAHSSSQIKGGLHLGALLSVPMWWEKPVWNLLGQEGRKEGGSNCPSSQSEHRLGSCVLTASQGSWRMLQVSLWTTLRSQAPIQRMKYPTEGSCGHFLFKIHYCLLYNTGAAPGGGTSGSKCSKQWVSVSSHNLPWHSSSLGDNEGGSPSSHWSHMLAPGICVPEPLSPKELGFPSTWVKPLRC